MENGNPNGQPEQNELTSKANSPNLNRGGDIFMADGEPTPGKGPGTLDDETRATAEVNAKAAEAKAKAEAEEAAARAREAEAHKKETKKKKEPSREEEAEDAEVTPEQRLWAENAWDYVNSLRGGEISNSERQAQQEKINRGIGPNDMVMSADVIANSELTDDERIHEVEILLGHELTPEQKEGLIAAHEVGVNEPGLIPGTEAGVYNYTEAQLWEKVRLLKDVVGIKNAEERRLLIETGLAGMAGPPPAWEGEQRIRETVDFYTEQYIKNPDEFERQFRKISPYSTDGVDPALISFICNGPDPKLLYSFVNTIAALPLETELVDYDLGLYAGTTMSNIIAELRPTLGSESPWSKRYGAEMGRIIAERGFSSVPQSEQQKERFNKVTERVEAFKLMHQVNKDIVTDATDAFANAAAIITPTHLQTLLDIGGVPVVMRLFEPNYQSLLTGKDGKVTGENEAKMLGKEVARSELGEAMANIDPDRQRESIEEQLRDLVRQAKGYPDEKGNPTRAPNPYLSELADMQDWEIRLAANSAKILENLTLRSIEHISHNSFDPDNPMPGFPKERVARIFSLILEVKRYKSGLQTAGMEYFDCVLKWYQKLRQKHGYGVTHITKLFGGKDIGDYEAQGLLKSGSMFAAWRGRGSIIDKAPMVDEGELTSIGKYIDGELTKRRDAILVKLGHPKMVGVLQGIEKQLRTPEEGYRDDPGATREQNEAFKKERDIRFKAKFEAEAGKNGGFNRFNRRFERSKTDDKPDLLREIFLAKEINPDGSIKRNRDGSICYVKVTNPDGSTDYELDSRFTNAYGTLYKIDEITPTETDFQVPGLHEAKAAVREAIWKRMADENPMALAFLMSGMDFDDKKGGPFTGEALDKFRLFARRLNPDEPDPTTATNMPKKYTYRNLLKKLNTANEIRLSSIEQHAVDISLQAQAEQLERDGKREEALAIRAKIKNKPALSLDEVLGKKEFQEPLTGEETALLKQIRDYGRNVAGELTTVRFPFIPIMNDITWGGVDFNASGAIFYSRQIGDLVGRFGAWKKIEPFQRSPNAFNPFTDVIEVFKKAKEDLTGPVGTGAAQDILLPFELAHWDMIQAGSQFGDIPIASGIMKFLASNLFIREIAHNTNLSNSRAQVWGGVDAPALDVVAMNDLANAYMKNALMRRGDKIKGADGRNKYSDIYNFVRKKYRISSWGIPFWLLAIIGDLFLPVVIGGVNEVRKKTTEKQQ